MSPIAAPDPDDAGDGTLYADPALLEHISEHTAEENAREYIDPGGGAKADSPVMRLLRSRWIETEDVPRNIDARDWPRVDGMPDLVIEYVEGMDVPKHRLRQLRFADGRIVYEVWTPLPRALRDDEIWLASKGNLPIGSWRLTYHVYSPEWCTCPQAKLEPHAHGLFHPACGRLKKSKVEGSFDEHVLSLQMQTDDEAIYNGYYPTLPGNDIAHFNPHAKGMAAHQGGDPIKLFNPPRLPNGKVEDEYLRGGTEIRGGRAEHRRLTKDATELAPGSSKEWAKQDAEKKAKQKAADRLKIEKTIQLGPRQVGEL